MQVRLSKLIDTFGLEGLADKPYFPYLYNRLKSKYENLIHQLLKENKFGQSSTEFTTERSILVSIDASESKNAI